MSEVKRYKFVWDGEWYAVSPDEDVTELPNVMELVLYSDYATLTAERDRLREAVEQAIRQDFGDENAVPTPVY